MGRDSLSPLNNATTFLWGNTPRTPSSQDGRGEQWQILWDVSAPANPGIKYVIYHSNSLQAHHWSAWIQFNKVTLLWKLYQGVIVKLTTLIATSYMTSQDIGIQNDLSWSRLVSTACYTCAVYYAWLELTSRLVSTACYTCTVYYARLELTSALNSF